MRCMVDNYYQTLLEFFNSIGKYLHLEKLGINAREGVFPAQKVAREYGYDESAYDLELEARKRRYIRLLDELSEIGIKVGFKPISDEGKKKILNFIKDERRRRYVRDVARRCSKKGELVSIAELMQRRYELEKKKRK